MDKQRILELAGMITEAKREAKKTAGIPEMWTAPEGFFTKPAGEIVKGLLSAGEKKAMARLKAGFKGVKEPKALEKYKRAQEMMSVKLSAMKEELEATAKRAGIILEKKKHDIDLDGEGDPDMKLDDDAPADDDKSDDGDDKPVKSKKKKEGGEEEDPLPAIVHKIAKKAVGKDEEELETLIMKVYDAGHKDGIKDADDDGSDKPKKKKKKDSDDSSDDAPDDADDKPSKKDSKDDMPSMYDHHKTMKNQSANESEETKGESGSQGLVTLAAFKAAMKKEVRHPTFTTDKNGTVKCRDGHDELIDQWEPKKVSESSWADAYIITEKHHVKKKGKVVKVGSKKECKDYMDDNENCTLHKGEPKKLDEMFLNEKHHVKKGKQVVKVGSKKECKDYCDDNKGCTLHAGAPAKITES